MPHKQIIDESPAAKLLKFNGIKSNPDVGTIGTKTIDTGIAPYNFDIEVTPGKVLPAYGYSKAFYQDAYASDVSRFEWAGIAIFVLIIFMALWALIRLDTSVKKKRKIPSNQKVVAGEQTEISILNKEEIISDSIALGKSKKEIEAVIGLAKIGMDSEKIAEGLNMSLDKVKQILEVKQIIENDTNKA